MQPQAPPTTTQRLLRLLATERKTITYVYLYATFVGIISLSLPLGIQYLFNLVSTGMTFSSVYVLSGVIIIGVFITGLLLIGQLKLVENIQQRIFAKASFEFLYRLPRIEPAALEEHRPAELMNRFFEVVTIQKALPKLLIDLTAALVQMLAGILLLTFYHPFFLGFGFLMLLVLVGICWMYGPAGLRTSLKESKYKYEVVDWLQQMASHADYFRNDTRQLSPMLRMDKLTTGYLQHRQGHFGILKKFYYTAVTFRTVVTGGLLIMGTVLVVSRQMSLGQFVAAELIIVMVNSAVEKLISGIDTVFDLLTGVEKLAAVTDLPLVDSAEQDA